MMTMMSVTGELYDSLRRLPYPLHMQVMVVVLRRLDAVYRDRLAADAVPLVDQALEMLDRAADPACEVDARDAIALADRLREVNDLHGRRLGSLRCLHVLLEEVAGEESPYACADWLPGAISKRYGNGEPIAEVWPGEMVEESDPRVVAMREFTKAAERVTRYLASGVGWDPDGAYRASFEDGKA